MFKKGTFLTFIGAPFSLHPPPPSAYLPLLQISMPALKEHIYGSRSVTAEAQHSIMHALFLIIRSKPSKCSENLQQGLKIFNTLFCEYFKTTMEVWFVS